MKNSKTDIAEDEQSFDGSFLAPQEVSAVCITARDRLGGVWGGGSSQCASISFGVHSKVGSIDKMCI